MLMSPDPTPPDALDDCDVAHRYLAAGLMTPETAILLALIDAAPDVIRAACAALDVRMRAATDDVRRDAIGSLVVQLRQTHGIVPRDEMTRFQIAASAAAVRAEIEQRRTDGYESGNLDGYTARHRRKGAAHDRRS